MVTADVLHRVLTYHIFLLSSNHTASGANAYSVPCVVTILTLVATSWSNLLFLYSQQHIVPSVFLESTFDRSRPVTRC